MVKVSGVIKDLICWKRSGVGKKYRNSLYQISFETCFSDEILSIRNIRTCRIIVSNQTVPLIGPNQKNDVLVRNITFKWHIESYFIRRSLFFYDLYTASRHAFTTPKAFAVFQENLKISRNSSFAGKNLIDIFSNVRINFIS